MLVLHPQEQYIVEIRYYLSTPHINKCVIANVGVLGTGLVLEATRSSDRACPPTYRDSC